ncbi:hypothetical protein VP01_11295g1 [Puccinia sorghi]|uniref:Uncharacterized protein n=1 Tax=Puccinia sorghi TaxID=27349 RepID=A0A0L6VTM7_9BASI|nr:hypothetical protein VP01_11295g1 [Puccinia sorghi]
MTIFHSNHIAFHCMAELDWIFFIIKIFQKVPQQPISYLGTYKDVRTITKRLRLNPELERTIFFPKCFSLYEPEFSPTTC